MLDALGWAIGTGLTTSMIVCDGISERIFTFAPDRVTVLRSGPRRSGTIGSVLVEDGFLTEDRLQDVVARSQASGRRFGEAAVDLGLVTYADVGAAIQKKVEEEILDVFFWPGAEFRTLEGETPETYRDGRYFAAAHACELAPFLSALMERVAGRRAVLGRLPSGREVYRLSDFPDFSDLPELAIDLLGEFDGTRLVNDIIEAAPMRRCPAWELVLCALRDGILVRVPSAEVQDLVDEAAAREIELLERVLERAVDPSVARMRLARACERTGQIARAASHWHHAGDDYRAQEIWTRASECYGNCVRLAPTDFGAREKILDIHHRQRAFGRVVTDGRPLAELLIKHNLLNRAKRLLLQLVAIEPRDCALRRQLVAVLTGLGERGVALHHQRELAAMLAARGAPKDEVLEAYMQVLAVDADDTKVRTRIDRLTGAAAQRRLVWGTTVATALLLAAFGGAFVYEADAREEVAAALPGVKVKLSAEDFVGASEAMRESAAGHTYSLASSQARELAERIDALATKEVRTPLINPIERARARIIEEREARARVLANGAHTLLKSGDLEATLSRVRELLDEYGGSDVVREGHLRAPLRLDVLPEDATISLDGVEVGQGSTVVEYDPTGVTTLKIESPNFAAREIEIRGLRDDVALQLSLAPPRLWTYTGQAEIAAAPLIDADRAIVPGRDRRVTALSLVDGSELWVVTMGLYADVGTTPVRVDAGLVVATGAGDVVCLDRLTGDVIWSRSLGIAVEAQPIATRGADGVVVIAAADGRLMGLAQRDGATRWDLGPQTIARDTSPRLVGATSFAYVATTHGLAVAGLGDGLPRLRPSRDLGLVTTPVIELGFAWVATREKTLRTISTQDGRALQSFSVPGGAPFAPCIVGDVAFTPSGDGSLLAFRADGETIFRATLREPAGGTPAHAAGVLYVPGTQGRLLALDASTGTTLWYLDCGAPLRATPAIGPGVVLVPTSGGRLIAIAR